MNLIVESNNLEEYLCETEEVDFMHMSIQKLIAILFNKNQSEVEKISIAYEYVRDGITHSWDARNPTVTRKASEVLQLKTGICYAKSNLLAALLRACNIPCGFCYQRLMLFDTPEKGYSFHTLNAVYIRDMNKWVCIDARGNKPGVAAEFSIKQEKLAFTVNEQMDE